MFKDLNLILTDEQVIEKENKIKKNKEKHFTRYIPLNNMLTPIVTILLMLLVLLTINFDHFCYLNNKECYEQSTAIIKDLKVDKLAMIIPMVNIEYTYQDCVYNQDKYFVFEYLFPIDYAQNCEMDIYINKLQPECTLTKTNFFENNVNIIIVLIIIYCILNFILKIVNNRKYRIEQKIRRHKKKHKKELQRAIREMYANDVREDKDEVIKKRKQKLDQQKARIMEFCKESYKKGRKGFILCLAKITVFFKKLNKKIKGKIDNIKESRKKADK